MHDIDYNIIHLTSNQETAPLQFRWCEYGDSQPLIRKVDYHQSYFEKEEAEALVKRVLFIMEQFSASLGRKAADIDLLLSEERQLLVDFNATEAAYPEDKTIVDLFEEQVAGEYGSSL